MLDALKERFRTALREERALRNYAFVGLSFWVAGIEVYSMTLRHMARLEGMGNPYICGGTATEEDALQLLHVVAIDQDFDNFCAAVDTSKVMGDVSQYIADIFLDAPGSDGSSSVSYVATTATYVHLFAREYHWSRESIQDAPMAELFQYIKLLSKTRNPDAILFNRRSGPIKRDYVLAKAES